MLANIIDWSGRNRAPWCCWPHSSSFWRGFMRCIRTPLDALPDLSDVQVIVYTEFPGQAPQVVEDQVTYPLTSAMLSVPEVGAWCAGFSFLVHRLCT